MNRKIPGNSIFLLQRIIPHYRYDVFNMLIDKFKFFFVFYGQTYKSDSLKNAVPPDNNNFVFKKITYFFSNTCYFSNVTRDIVKYHPKVIITIFNMGNINVYLLFILRFFFRFKIILWSFGYDYEIGFDPTKRIKDKIRLFLYQKADAVIFYWNKGKIKISEYSKYNEHYFVAPNTINTEALIRYKQEYDAMGIDLLKAKLGVAEKFHFVFVSRLIPDKHADLLLKAAKILKDSFRNIRFTIIGDGPELSLLKNYVFENRLDNVYFLGEILEQNIVSKWIYISNAFIIPGRLGNNVAQSFSLGVPVISQKRDDNFHGEGVEYLKDGINGYLFKENDFYDLSEKIKFIIENESLTASLRYNAFETLKSDASVEKFIEGFENAINYVCS